MDSIPDWYAFVRIRTRSKRCVITALQVVLRVMGSEPWQEMTSRRREDLLVYLALVVPRSSVEELAPALRVFEGCARALVGDVDGANVVKLHRFSGKVTYLVCGAIDRDPNPEVLVRVKVNLRTLAIDIFDYADWAERSRLNVDLTRLPG
jgi:hypothetical protein